MLNKGKSKIFFRNAVPTDVANMVQLEKDVWGEGGADCSKLESRIAIFPEGNILAVRDNDVVGYVAFQYVDDVRQGGNFTWDEITDEGTIKNSHKPDGKFVYGINLTVHQSKQGLNLGNALVIYGLSVVFANNKIGTFIGSRMPGFGRFNKKHPDVLVDDYARLRHKGKLRDPELQLYEEEGFAIEKVLPGYFPDPPSLDYGVLVYAPNRFHGNFFRIIISWFIKIVAFRMIKDARKEV